METPVKSDEFMCRCTPEASKRCDEVLAAAYELLREEYRVNDGDKEILWFGAACLGKISAMADQWCWVGIEIPVWDGTKHTGEKREAGFMCDRVSDGLAACIVWAKQEEKDG